MQGPTEPGAQPAGRKEPLCEGEGHRHEEPVPRGPWGR